MSGYYVGQRVNVATQVKNQAQQLADATMNLVVYRADGTQAYSGAPANHPSVGNYNHDVTLDTAGDWWWQFTASGNVEAVDVGQAHVVTAGPLIIGLDDAKEHRNVTSTADDRELTEFIRAAQNMLEGKVGPTVPRTVTETQTVSGYQLALYRRPVLSVTSVIEYLGIQSLGVVPSSDYTVDAESGVLTRGCGWLGDSAQVVYQAGRRPIPEHFRLAAKELVGHLWMKSQTIRGGLRGDRASAEQTVAALGYAMPNAVLEMIADDMQ